MAGLTELSIASKRELEHGFAGCAFADPALAMQQAQWLDPSELSDLKVKEFWEKLRENYTAGEGDQAAMKAAMETNILTDVMGWGIDAPYITVIKEYAEEIRRRNYVIGMDKSLAKLMEARKKNDVEGIMAALEVLTSNKPPSTDSLPDAGDAHLMFTEIVTSPMMHIVKTHIPPIDKAIGGLERKTLTVIGARPSVGKSTLAWQIARNVAASGQKALYYSNDMSTTGLWSKVACGAMGIVWRDVLSGNISAATRQKLIDVSAEACDRYGANLLIDDKTNNSVQSIWRRVIQCKPDVVVVDVIAGVKERAESEERRIAAITNGLREISKDTDTAVLAVHHINREGEKTEGRPTMANLRYSGEVEQSADTVMIMHNPVFYAAGAIPDRVDMQIWVDKNKLAPRNSLIELIYLTKQQFFEPKNGVQR